MTKVCLCKTLVTVTVSFSLRRKIFERAILGAPSRFYTLTKEIKDPMWPIIRHWQRELNRKLWVLLRCVHWSHLQFVCVFTWWTILPKASCSLPWMVASFFASLLASWIGISTLYTSFTASYMPAWNGREQSEDGSISHPNRCTVICRRGGRKVSLRLLCSWAALDLHECLHLFNGVVSEHTQNIRTYTCILHVPCQ